MKYKNPGYKVFTVVNYFLLTLLAVLCVLPFVHIVAISFSDQASTAANKVILIPIGFNTIAYGKVFKDSAVWSSLFVTLGRMFLGTLYSMILTITVAFPLSFEKSAFRGRTVYVVYFFITMIFGGGLVPYYILMKNMGLMDTIWSLVVGSAPIGMIIILLNFYRQLPVSLMESAKIDGASYFVILRKIYFPLSIPSVATLSLMSLVAHWNDWFGGMIYMKDPAKYPLQTLLYTRMVTASEFTDMSSASNAVSHQSQIAALTVFTILPVLFAFPLLQKYVKSGLVLGSVKE